MHIIMHFLTDRLHCTRLNCFHLLAAVVIAKTELTKIDDWGDNKIAVHKMFQNKTL